MFLTGDTKDQIREYIISETIEKVKSRTYQILNAIEETGIYLEDVEYYLTNCIRNFRLDIYEPYKANRKSNKWVKAIRQRLIDSEFAMAHESLEADDLIAIRAEQLREINWEFIIISIDKDLAQIHGIHYNYYPLYDESGFIGFKGLYVMSEFESQKHFAKQMLIGDSTDNIKGCRKIGVVKAEKALQNCTTKRQLIFAVYRQYHLIFRKDNEYEYWSELAINYKLLKLGL
ncbi:MAG: hypothetical protein ACK518_00795 [bacterium]|jgi:5'-3' exonuclease